MLFDVLRKMADELPGCELTSVVSLETGLSLACVSADQNGAAAADAFHGEFYRVARGAMNEIGLDGPIEDVVIQGDRRVFVSTPIGDSGYFWHVATSAETTLGFTQALMRKYRDDIEAGVRDLLS
jgi:predicted regulator of Ras-like GTPase activity (Roadblock/LC7/MglB family)